MVSLIFEGKFEVKAPRPKVWEFIIDPSRIGRCLPDLKSLEVESEDRFVALVRVGVGPIKADFKFKIEIVEKTPINGARLKAAGLALEVASFWILRSSSQRYLKEPDFRTGRMSKLVGLWQALANE